MRVIIADTSCLIALDKIGKLELLHKVLDKIEVTTAVKAEFGYPLATWIVVRDPKNSILINHLNQKLDLGESTAIVLAIETQDSLLIIDEKKGRSVAKEMRVEIIGTLKFILLAKRKGAIPSVLNLVQELNAAGFRFSKEIVRSILMEAGEN